MKEFIKRLKETTSVVDFYEFKPEIIRLLGGSDSPERTKRKKELSAMKMADLRKIGEQFGVDDNDKSELVNEILDKEGL